MALSHPVKPRWVPHTPPSEKLLWQWAVDQLPADVLVLPQVAVTIDRGGRTEATEVDLVIVDPAFGVVVVEVKGTAVAGDHPERTRRRRSRRPRRLSAAAHQARRALDIVRAALQQAGVDTTGLALRWAVGVPEVFADAPDTPALRGVQLWDRACSRDLLRAYRATCAGHADEERPPGVALTERIAETLRGRSLRPLRTHVARHEQRVRVLTESHRNVLHHFATHQRVLVRGGAGTGKTTLAVHAAARLAAFGERVLLACWNVVLAGGLRDSLRAELEAMGSPRAGDVTDDPTGTIVAGHLAGLAGRVTEIPIDADTDYFQNILPATFTSDVTGGTFDAIVLDEAQDLSDAWMTALDALLAPGGRWYAFADRHQDLFASRASLRDFLELEHELRDNFRNSRHIAEFAARYGPAELDCINADGPPVRYLASPSDRISATAEREARRLLRSEGFHSGDLAVLWLFHNPMRGRNDAVVHAAATGQLVRTNSATFKGVERPVVVLALDLDPEKRHRAAEAGRAIYVAATRARSSLTVVGDPHVAAAFGFEELARHLKHAARQPVG